MNHLFSPLYCSKSALKKIRITQPVVLLDTLGDIHRRRGDITIDQKYEIGIFLKKGIIQYNHIYLKQNPMKQTSLKNTYYINSYSQKPSRGWKCLAMLTVQDLATPTAWEDFHHWVACWSLAPCNANPSDTTDLNKCRPPTFGTGDIHA